VAEADLAEIWVYLAAEASPDIANAFVESIAKAFEPVRHHPHSGAARDAFSPDLRVTFHRRYAIYYRALADRLVIIRVLHGARDAAAIAEQGGFEG
jgi:toxin ParE1/3/4